jgi:hypothetical protein
MRFESAGMLNDGRSVRWGTLVGVDKTLYKPVSASLEAWLCAFGAASRCTGGVSPAFPEVSVRSRGSGAQQREEEKRLPHVPGRR